VIIIDTKPACESAERRKDRCFHRQRHQCGGLKMLNQLAIAAIKAQAPMANENALPENG
jgi:hypothetical protein